MSEQSQGEVLVNVLLSAYNGGSYVFEQIDSILAQERVATRIVVRDDGSTDGTPDRLRAHYGDAIELVVGNNVGYARSFMWLLRQTSGGTYWAFSDQDDIWLPDKLARAVSWLDGQEGGVPCLWSGSYDLTTADGRSVTGSQRPSPTPLDFRRSLTECRFQGFTIVFNGELRELMLRADPGEHVAHDLWAGELACKFGITRHDPQVSALHRRLDISESAQTLRKRSRWLLRALSKGDADISDTARAFVRCFPDLDDEDVAWARAFATRSHRLRRAFWPGRWRPSLSSELALRTLMLLGRV